MEKLKPKEKEELLHLSFNQDQSFLAVGTQSGFKVFKSTTFKELFSRDFGSGIGIVEMVNHTNILALVGGGKTPRYPKNKVMIWDDSVMKSIIETNCKSDIRAVRLKPDRCVIVLETKVFVFNFADFKVLNLLDTCPNPKGLCSVATKTDNLILAIPSKKIGSVQVHFQNSDQKAKVFQAHKSTLCAMQLSASGTRLATASQKGTIIRVFDVLKGQIIQQLRRGSEYATIYSIAISQEEKWLACSSDSGTIHIFGLNPIGKELSEQDSKTKKSKSFFKMISSYFDSQRSFAQFKVHDKKMKVAFLQQPCTLAIASTEGKVYVVQFDGEKGGECVCKKVHDIYEKEGRQQ